MMMMMVVVPNQVLTSRTEQSIWILFHFFDLEVQQDYLRCLKRCPLGCLKTS